jgi:hypothetical protein
MTSGPSCNANGNRKLRYRLNLLHPLIVAYKSQKPNAGKEVCLLVQPLKNCCTHWKKTTGCAKACTLYIKKGHCQNVEFKHVMCKHVTTHCAMLVAFWSTKEKGRVKVQHEYRNDILRNLQIFCQNSKVTYIMVLKIYTVFESCESNIPHSFNKEFKGLLKNSLRGSSSFSITGNATVL